MSREFQVVCEIEPPTRPDLRHARHQIGTLAPVCDAFLVPDNHLGRATVSSIAVATEIQAMGGRTIACLNSRDRNLLGFRRDLLTAAAYGVEDFLFVAGDKPTAGGRTGELTVRAMVDEARTATDDPAFEGVAPFRVGVTAGHGRPLPAWKQAADAVFLQIGFAVEDFLRWRDANPVDVPVHAGVMVLASAGMARRLRATVPDIAIPDALVAALRDSGAFAGVHLVPVARFRSVAARLEESGFAVRR